MSTNESSESETPMHDIPKLESPADPVDEQRVQWTAESCAELLHAAAALEVERDCLESIDHQRSLRTRNMQMAVDVLVTEAEVWAKQRTAGPIEHKAVITMLYEKWGFDIE